MKTPRTLRAIGIVAVAVLAIVCIALVSPDLTRFAAQTSGYRWGQNNLIFSGMFGGDCREPSYNGGVDGCLDRTGVGQISYDLGTPNTRWAQLPRPPVIALATATSGGTIADGTSFRLALTYVTPTGGRTDITSASEATQTTTGGGLSTITATAPIAAAGAAGYEVWSTNSSGVGNSNTTLTETLQPMNTAVCAGAFAVDGPAGPGTGPTVCPFGVNAVLTSLTFTGQSAPVQNTAGYPSALPQLIANLVQVPTLSTITTIQTFATVPLRAGLQNFPGKVLHVTGHGRYTSGAQTGTMTITLTEGGITPITVTSPPIITGGQTNAQFQFDYKLTTNKTGAAGTLWGHGVLCVNLQTAANTAAMSCSGDALTAVSSPINLTAQNNLASTITMSSSTTSATLDDEQVYLEN